MFLLSVKKETINIIIMSEFSTETKSVAVPAGYKIMLIPDDSVKQQESSEPKQFRSRYFGSSSKRYYQSKERGHYKETIQALYDNVKKTFISCISQCVEMQNPDIGTSLLVISLGDGKRIPQLDFKCGKTQSNNWTYDRTILQYINGIKYKKNSSNIPDHVKSETLRYQHTDPDISEPVKLIQEDTEFQPVISDKLIFDNGSYVLLHNIFKNDVMFIKTLNDELKKIDESLSVEIVDVEPTNEEIIVNEHKLTLRNSYVKLVLKSSRDRQFDDRLGSKSSRFKKGKQQAPINQKDC